MSAIELRVVATAILVGALLTPGARAQETAEERANPWNRIGQVRIEREAAQTLVRVEGDRAPVFSVYTLHDPLRLVVDLAQGDVSRLETPIEVDDGVLTKIVAAQYGEGKRAVGRLILGFARQAPYDVKAEGNSLVVRIAAVGKARPSAAALAAKDAELARARAELLAQTRALEAARQASAEAETRAREARAALEALTREAELARTQASKALERAQAEGTARASEAARRQELEGKLAQAEQALARERQAVRTAEEALARQQEAARRLEAELVTARRSAQGDLDRKLQEKEEELRQVRERLEARGREVEASRLAAAAAEKSAREAALARQEETARRQEVERRLAEAEGALVREKEALRKAEGALAALREELRGTGGAERALAHARSQAEAAARELEALRAKAAALAEAEQQVRQNRTREAEAERLRAESRALAERLARSEKNLRELEALRARVEEAKGSEAAARALLAHKTAEVEALKTRLAAAERLAHATATELERSRAREAERAQTANAARETADAHSRRAQAASEAAGPMVAGQGAAKISVAGGPVTMGGAILVKDVGYQSQGGKSQVVLTVEGEPNYVVHRKGGRRLVLDLPGARLPKHLQRKLDVSEFEGPVAMVSAYESTSPVQAARVTVDLRGPASYEVTRAGNDLRLVLGPAPAGAERPADRRLAQAKEPDTEVLEEARPTPAARKRTAAKKQPSYRGRRINLDLQDADLHTVLKLISEVIRLNFVVSDEVRGKVTMTLRDVPWDQALEIILRSKGIGYVREGNIIRVAPLKVLEKEAEEEAKRQVVVKEAQPILLKVLTVNYSKAEEIAPRIRDLLSEKGSVSFDRRSNRIIVRDVQQRIRAAERLLKKLDLQTPQVLIEARIVEANTTFSRDIGIQWGGDITMSPANGNPTGLVFPSTVGIAGGAPLGLSSAAGLLNPAAPHFAVNLPAATGAGAGGAVGFTFGSIGGNVNLTLRLSAAEENGQAKIISAPKITTLDNQKATIQQGVSIPISQSSALGVNTIFVDANLTLTVTPKVTPDGSVIMDIIATKNEPDFQRTGALGDPTILRKEARTQVLIKDGDTTVIGGIYTRNVTTNYRQVPFLSQIPILGWLFKKKLDSDTRTELLIFITPRIVNRPEAIGT
jgi:type IV pilus assembly protein PilQ